MTTKTTAPPLPGLDPDLELVMGLTTAVRDMRRALDRLEAMRDASIRRYAGEGVNRVHLARSLGFSRSGLYSILEPSTFTDQDGEVWVDEDAAERGENLWNEALSRWEHADHEGTPDDYFPLEDVVANP